LTCVSLYHPAGAVPHTIISTAWGSYSSDLTEAILKVAVSTISIPNNIIFLFLII